MIIYDTNLTSYCYAAWYRNFLLRQPYFSYEKNQGYYDTENVKKKIRI